MAKQLLKETDLPLSALPLHFPLNLSSDLPAAQKSPLFPACVPFNLMFIPSSLLQMRCSPAAAPYLSQSLCGWKDRRPKLTKTEVI